MERKTIIIGAGPIGMTLAAKLSLKKEDFLLLEKGNHVCNNVLKWGHVKMFTPVNYTIDKDVIALLKAHTWSKIDILNYFFFKSRFITGLKLVQKFFNPLYQISELKDKIFLNAEVVRINRKDNLFTISYLNNGKEKSVICDFVIDASGNWGNFNTVYPKNETFQIGYNIPDVANNQNQYLRQKIAVIGSGHSAMNTINFLGKLKEQERDIDIYWLVRNKPKFKTNKVVSQSLALEKNAKKHLKDNRVTLYSDFQIKTIVKRKNNLLILSEKGVQIEVSKIFANTGCHSDYSLLSNFSIELDEDYKCSKKIKNKVNPEVNKSCLVSYNLEDLKISKLNYYVIGMKSFGKMSNFLLWSCYGVLNDLVSEISENQNVKK